MNKFYHVFLTTPIKGNTASVGSEKRTLIQNFQCELASDLVRYPTKEKFTPSPASRVSDLIRKAEKSIRPSNKFLNFDSKLESSSQMGELDVQ